MKFKGTFALIRSGLSWTALPKTLNFGNVLSCYEIKAIEASDISLGSA
jgi:hypothetical protein